MKGLDYILDGVGSGDVADRLIESNMDPNALRPWRDKKGRKWVSLVNGFDPKTGKPNWKHYVTNAATLTKEAWLQIDTAIIRAARPQLKVWGDLVNEGLTFTVPDGMGTTVIQHQTMTDAGQATFSMDGLRQTYRDRPQFDLTGIPLPIVHADFSFSAREISVSRRSGVPLDTAMAEQETRKVMEGVEKLTIGTLGSYSYGGYSIFGLTNYTYRQTKVLTLPTAAGWTPDVTYNEVLDMIQAMQDVFFNGPYAIYYSPGWTKYFDTDYSAAYPGFTLRRKLEGVGDVRYVRKADYLTNYQIVIVQLTSDVIQAVTGMRLTTVQWDSHGGLQKNFKVMAIMVPRIRRNSDNNTGISHGTAA